MVLEQYLVGSTLEVKFSSQDETKIKTAKGFFWSFIENFLSQIVTFIVGIVLSRLLSPDLFGMVGMIVIFIAISEIFVNSGFHQSLIRKQNANQEDFSTIFFTNLGIAFVFLIALLGISPSIAQFYGLPILGEILPVFGIVVFIDALALVQKTDLTRKLDFKLLAKISLVSNLVGGSIGIIAAYQGLGVWSLVMKSIFQKLTSTILLWLQNKWRPLLIFNWVLLKEHFRFGNKLLISGIIDTIFANLYYLVIGKYFSMTEVGYYSRADQFQKMPSSNFSSVVSRVSFPVLAALTGNDIELRLTFRKLLQGTMIVSISMMSMLAAFSDTLIEVLIGKAWLPCVIYLKLLCVIGMFYPLHHLNLLIPQVVNRPEIFLRLEIIKKIILVMVVGLGVQWGVVWMLQATIVFNVVAYFLHAWSTARLINYSIVSQTKTLIGPLILGCGVYISVALLRMICDLDTPFLFLLIQVLVSVIAFYCGVRLFFREYYNIFLSLLMKQV